MDSPATQTTSTTLNKNVSLARYNEKYSEYIQRMVNIHNDNQLFSVYPARDRGFRLRSNLKSMQRLLKEMQKLALASYKEQLNLDRYQKYLKRIERQRLYEQKKRKKKNG